MCCCSLLYPQLDGLLVGTVCQAMAMSLAQWGDNTLGHHAWATEPAFERQEIQKKAGGGCSDRGNNH